MIFHKQRILQTLSRALSGTKFFLILLYIFSISLTSCDESSVVGLDVQPANDLLNVKYTDSISIVTQTIKGDSLRTDASVILNGIALIGKYNDPIFGTSTASLYTQLRLLTTITPTSFGTSPLVDSVVLSLAYDTAYYGKRDRKAQNINVYEVTEDILPVGNAYYSSKTLATSSTDLANNLSFIPRPADSVSVLGSKLKPHLRIRLNSALGQTILDNQATGKLADNPSLQSFIKGLYITTENTSSLGPGEGNILYFKMMDKQTRLTVYYRNAAADSLKYDFTLDIVSRFMHFNHDFSSANADLLSQVSSGTFSQNNTVYVQSLAGVRTKIATPYLMHLNDSGRVSINKAELVIKVNTDPLYQQDTFAVPKGLVLFGINDDGTTYPLSDFYEGTSYHSGTYNSTTKEYRFNIARYVQQVLSGEHKNNGLQLLTANGAVSGNRSVIGGGSGSNQMKLNITYTKLH